MDPGVTKIGIAYEEGYACLDVYSKWVEQPDHAPVAYPAAGAVDVATALDDPGPINPFPAGMDPPTGPIVTLTFAPSRTVSDTFSASVVVEATGEQLPAFVRLPRDPTDVYAEFQLNTVSVTPRAPLAPESTYRVIMKGEVGDEYYENQWTFSTAGTPGAQ